MKAPPDFKLAKADGSPGEVTFSHQRHLARAVKCTTCHMRDFKLKRGGSGPFTMTALQEGKLCGACHDGQAQIGGVTVFSVDACDRCHK